MKPNFISPTVGRLALLLTAAALPTPAFAALTWNSTGPTNNWSSTGTDTNWLPGGVLWTQNEDAVFDFTSGTPEAVVVTTANTFNNITFSVDGFSITNGAGSLLLANDLASTITVTNVADTAQVGETIANNAGGASTLTKAGAGTLILNSSAASTYTGGTIISAGTLGVTQAGGMGTGPVTNNATLNLTTGNVTYSGISTSMSGNGTVNVTVGTGSNTNAFNGDYSAFTGTWNIGIGAAAGAGKVQMNGLDNAGASISLLENATLFTNGPVTHVIPITLKGGDTGESIGQLRVEGNTTWAGPITLDGVITGSGDGFLGSFTGGTGTYSGVIGEAGGARVLSKAGAGTSILTGMNTYSGGTSVLAGTLSVGVLNNTGNAGNVGTGSTINLGNGGTASTLNYTGAGETTDRVINFAGTTGGAFIAANGTGLLRLTSNTTTSGAGAKGMAFDGSGNGQLDGSMVNNTGVMNITKQGTGTWTLGGPIQTSDGGATSALTVSAGTLNLLNGANSYAGVTTINGGSLALGADTAAGVGTIRFGGATASIRSTDMSTRTVANAIDFANHFNFGSPTTGNLVFTGATGVGTGAKDFNVLNAITEFSGVISTSAVTTNAKSKSGPGTLVFSGDNTYVGPTAINAGTLRLNYDTGAGGTDSSKLSDTNPLVFNGGTLDLSGGTHTEIVASTTLGGIGTITRSSGSAVVQLGAITAAPGSRLQFEANNIATTNTLNSNGILGGWALMTSGGAITGWASNSTNAANGPITAYASGFADVNRLGGTITDDATSNVRIVNGGAGGNITLADLSVTQINSLLMSATAGPATIAPVELNDTFIVGSDSGGGILVLPNAGSLTIGAAANDSQLTTGGTSSATPATLGILNENPAATVTINSAITNNGTDVVSLSKTGAGTLLLNGTNTFTGSLGVGAGKVILGTTSSLSSATAIAIGSGATLDLNGKGITAASLGGAADGTFTDNGTTGGTSTVALTAANAAIPTLITDGPTRAIGFNLTNSNQAAGFLNPNNTFSGGITLLHSGTGTRLSVTAPVSTTGTPGAITSSNFGKGTITVGQTATDRAGIYFPVTATIANAIVANTNLGSDRVGTFRVDTTGNVLSGQLTANLAPMTFSTNGTGNLTTTGKITGNSGLMLLSHNLGGTALTVTLANTGAANDYAGDTTINQNPFAARSYTLALGAADQIPNGTGKGNVIINTATTGVGTLNLAGFNETINGLSGSGTVTTSTGTPTLTVGDNNAGGTFTGTVSGGLSLAKTGTGTLVLSGTNSYTGTTTVNGGTLQFLSALTSTGFTVAGGSTLDIQVATGVTQNMATSTLSGAGTFIKSGPGTLNWAATAGTFNFSPGALIDVQGGQLTGGNSANEVWTNNKSDLNVATGAIFDGVEANIRVDALTGAGTIKSGWTGSGYVNFTFGIDNGSGTFAGSLQNSSAAANFVKTGAGTQTLTGTNTYTGTTTVSGGALLVNGSHSGTGAVAVNSGGTLGGTGSIAGALTVNTGGIVAPGASAGTLTTGATVITGTYACEIDGATADKLAVTGNLNITGATLGVSVLGGGATQPEYVIATYTGTFNGLAEGATVTGGYTITYATTGQIKLISSGGPNYNSWAASFSPNPGAAGVDYESDGFDNGIEFILGGSPVSGSNNPKIYSFAADSNDGDTDKELIMTIAVPVGTPAFAAGAPATSSFAGFGIAVYGSTTLSPFPLTVTPVAPVVTGLPTAPFVQGGVSYEYRSFSLSGSNGLTGKGFMKVKVTNP